MKIAEAQEIQEARVELVPLIDCVFLLLIFFMCAAQMSKLDTITEVVLPVANKASVPKDMSGRGTVNILPLGALAVGDQRVSEEKPFIVAGDLVNDAGLTKAIGELRKNEPNMRLYLRVDKDVNFKLVRRAIAACAQAGIFDVILATYPNAVER